MTFEEIVSEIETPIIVAAPLGEPEEFIECEECHRLVRARPSAVQLHQDVTCELYRQAAAVAGRS